MDLDHVYDGYDSIVQEWLGPRTPWGKVTDWQHDPRTASTWSAVRAASRGVAWILLNEAESLGAPRMVMDELRKKAAEIAPD